MCVPRTQGADYPPHLHDPPALLFPFPYIQVCINGKQIWRSQIKLYYFAVNKPKGYICSAKPLYEDERTAISLMNDWLEQWKARNPEVRYRRGSTERSLLLRGPFFIRAFVNIACERLAAAEARAPPLHGWPAGCAIGGPHLHHQRRRMGLKVRSNVGRFCQPCMHVRGR